MTVTRKPFCVVDGIPCFTEQIPVDHVDYHATGIENLNAAERIHFWFVTRRERILSAFIQYLPLNRHVLEIGAGTAYVAQGLQSAGYEVAVGELHISGLRFAREKGIKNCYQFDLFDPPFHEEFDAIGMFDVLEHLQKDVIALRQVYEILKPGGKLFITVPAHQWLWCRDDAIASHKRRYSKKSLLHTVEASGFQVQEIQYIFSLILPLLYLRRLFNKDRGVAVTEHDIQSSEISINPLLNRGLLAITRLENRLSAWLPNIAGGSLLCVAKKPSVAKLV